MRQYVGMLMSIALGLAAGWYLSLFGLLLFFASAWVLFRGLGEPIAIGLIALTPVRIMNICALAMGIVVRIATRSLGLYASTDTYLQFLLR